MAVDLAWVFAGEEGLDGGIEVGLMAPKAPERRETSATPVMSALVRICRIALPFFSGVMSKPVIFMVSFRELGIEFAILSVSALSELGFLGLGGLLGSGFGCWGVLWGWVGMNPLRAALRLLASPFCAAKRGGKGVQADCLARAASTHVDA